MYGGYIAEEILMKQIKKKEDTPEIFEFDFSSFVCGSSLHFHVT